MYKLLAVLCLAAPAFCTVFQKCDPEPSVLAIQAGDCVDNCVFHLNVNLSHNVTFQPDHDVTSLTAVVYNGTELLITDTSVCSSLTTGKCPLSAGEKAVYRYFVYLAEALLGDLYINFHLLDQNSVPIGCYRLNVTILQ